MKRRKLILATLGLLLGFGSSHAQENGEYLLQNVETGHFLGGGNSWGTRATLLGKPQWFTLTQVSGGYTLDSHQYNNANDHFLGGNQYVDAPATTWTLTANGTGGYTLAHNGNYLAGDGQNRPTKTVTDAANASAQWRLVSPADLSAQLGTARVGKPVDATALIKNPEFKRNANTSHYPTWTVTAADGTGTPSNLGYGSGANNANCAESWRCNNGFHLTQTLSNLPNGTYRLEAQAFFRYEPGLPQEGPLPYVFMGQERANFPQITGTENSMAQAYTSFLAKRYPTEPLYVNTQDGTLTLGVHGDTNPNLWNIWGEFTLTYYGNVSVNEVKLAAYINAYESALVEAVACQTQPMAQADLDQLNEAISANTLDLTSATQDQLSAATQNLRTASEQAKKAIKKYANANAAAALLASGQHNFTQFIQNPSFDTGDLTGWTHEQGGNVASNGNFAQASGASNPGNNNPYFVERWTWSGTGNVHNLGNGRLTQSILGLPAGTYRLTAEMKAEQQGDPSATVSGYRLFLNNTATEASTPQTYSATYTLAEGEELNLGFEILNTTANWVCADNFTLTHLGTLATADDYQALSNAITAAESQNWGFEADEYAPYNNSGYLNTLAEAKAINPQQDNEKQTVNSLTTNLDLNLLVANQKELNAVYDGVLAEKAVSTNSGEANAEMSADGWNSAAGFRYILGDASAYPALTQTDMGRGVFMWTGTYTYGEKTGYTIPLEANTEYAISFKYAGWNGAVGDVAVSVLNSNSEGLARTSVGGAEFGPQTAGAFKTAYQTFNTGAGGNFVLNVNSNGNFTLADIKFYKHRTVTLDETATEISDPRAPLTVVNYPRTLLSGWNSLYLPFATSLRELGAEKAYTVGGTTREADGNYTLNLRSVTELKAHNPYIVLVNNDVTLNTFAGKSVILNDWVVAETEPTDAGSAGGFALEGTYKALSTGNTTIASGDYIVGAYGFKQAQGGNALKAFRTYLANTTGTSAGIKGFTIDGNEATAIETIELKKALTGNATYNLNGQRVEKTQQGIYILDGRKVAVK